MECIINNKFQHVSSFNNSLILNTLEVNLKAFLQHSFLSIGSWSDVQLNQQNLVTSPLSDLQLSEDPAYKRGQVWISAKKDWVYENTTYSNRSPISPVVYINNNVVQNGYIIDYNNGRIIFDNPKNPSSIIKTKYSYNNIQIHRSSDCLWWKLIESGLIDPKDIKSNGRGDWSIGPHHKIQMPCVVVDAISRAINYPYELGSKSLKIDQDVIFNVLAENKNDRNQILDIIRLQQDNTIWLFNINKAAQENKLTLDHNGSLNPIGLDYTNLVNEYKLAKTFFKNISLSEVMSINGIYEGVARVTFEIIFDSSIN